MISLEPKNVSSPSEVTTKFTGILSQGDQSSRTIEHYYLGLKHNLLGPAVQTNHTKTHYVLGVKHNIGGPAVEYANGQKEWWVKGQLHRVGGPAIIFPDGRKSWYLNNVFMTEQEHKVFKRNFQRLDRIFYAESLLELVENYTGVIIISNKSQFYYVDGQLHREGGPAVCFPNGEQFSFKDGKLHNIDGPAAQTSHKTYYFVDGVQVNSIKEFKEKQMILRALIVHDSGRTPSGTGVFCMRHGNRLNNRDIFVMNGYLHREEGPAVTFESGIQEWWFEGSLHRTNDLPARIFPSGTKEWWQMGARHRGDDQPAIVKIEGTQEWWINGTKHRENDQPAIIQADGSKFWYKNNLRHRDNNLPAIERINGDKEWFVEGKLHRVGSPAIEHTDGLRAWYTLGHKHRLDGPAEYRTGEFEAWYENGQLHRLYGPAYMNYVEGTSQWWINGCHFNYVDFKQERKKFIANQKQS